MSDFLIIVKGGRGANLLAMEANARQHFFASWSSWLMELKMRNHLIIGAPLRSEGSVYYSSGTREEVPENYDMISDMVTGFLIVRASTEKKLKALLNSCPLLDQDCTSIEIRELAGETWGVLHDFPG
ncbi:MAG: hypothetical protein ACK4E0_19110 [Chitinophagaceae bacterium]